MRYAFARAAVPCLVTVLGLNVAEAGTADANPSRPGASDASRGRLVQEGSRPYCGGQRPIKTRARAEARATRYTCTFSEEFDGEQLDPDTWMVQQTWFSGASSGNLDCLVDTPQNIAVSGGQLHLTAREEGREFVCRNPGGDFSTSSTGATVATYQRFAQAYGRFSFRARFPRTTAPGVHSALWLYPQEHTYGRWPDSGEIDVAEWFSSGVTTVLPSVHYRGEQFPHSTGWSCRMAEPWKWHTYTLTWKPARMSFSYDGTTCWRATWKPDAPLSGAQPFDKPFFIALTQVFGFNDNAVTAETPSSVTMDVNWVRVWK